MVPAGKSGGWRDEVDSSIRDGKARENHSQRQKRAGSAKFKRDIGQDQYGISCCIDL